MPPYPNPFNCQTILCFEVPKAEYISLIVYDIMGREICVLEEDFLLSGTYQVIFDASKFASGIYFAQLQAGDFMQTQKMVLMK
jgi:hypothetical protein